MQNSDTGGTFLIIPRVGPGGFRYYTDASYSILEEYFAALEVYLRTNPLDPNKMRLMQACCESKARFIEATTGQAILRDVSSREPLVLELVLDIANEVNYRRRLGVVQTYFARVFDSSDKATISNWYNRYIRELRLFDKVNKKLAHLVEKARLENNNIQFKVVRDAAIQAFKINVPSITVGYSIYTLLEVSREQSEDSEQPRIPYNGKLEFVMTFEELEALNNYLSDLYEWYGDFDTLLAGLLGTQSELYTKTGQKPLREVILAEEKRGYNLITRNVVTQLRQLPTELVVLLPNVCCIDLTAHPQRDVMKHVLEKLYADAGLRDSKNDQKVFVLNSYISVLSIDNIKNIYHPLMVYANLNQAAANIGMSAFSQEFASLYDNRLDLALFSYLRQFLLEFQIGNVNSNRTQVVLSANEKNLLTRHADNIFVQPNIIESAYRTYDRFTASVKRMLDEKCGVLFKPKRDDSDNQITQTHLYSLLPCASGIAEKTASAAFLTSSSTDEEMTSSLETASVLKSSIHLPASPRLQP